MKDGKHIMKIEEFEIPGCKELKVDWDDIPQWYYELLGCKVVKMHNRNCYLSDAEEAIGICRVMLGNLVVTQDIMRQCAGGYEDIWFYLGCDQDKRKLQEMPDWMQEMVNLFEQNEEFFQIESEQYPGKMLLVYYPKRLLKHRTEAKYYSEFECIVKVAMKIE